MKTNQMLSTSTFLALMPALKAYAAVVCQCTLQQVDIFVIL